LGAAAPVRLLLANRAFDAETTRLLGSAFDAAWATVRASGRPVATGRSELSVREALATCIIVVAQQGERDPYRLVGRALDRFADLRPIGAASPAVRTVWRNINMTSPTYH